MNALLLKDWYLLRKQSKLTMIMITIFLVIGASSGSFYAMIVSIIAVMLPLTTMAYDQMNHWDRFAIGLPIPRSLHVTSKYVLALLLLASSVLLMIIMGCGFVIFGSGPIERVLLTVWMQIAAGLFFITVNYPIVTKLGFERGRIWYVIITVPIVALGGLVNSLFQLHKLFDDVSAGMFAWLLIPGFLVWVSHKLSVRFIEHKEF
jgi:hypothetical protein